MPGRTGNYDLAILLGKFSRHKKYVYVRTQASFSSFSGQATILFNISFSFTLLERTDLDSQY